MSDFNEKTVARLGDLSERLKKTPHQPIGHLYPHCRKLPSMYTESSWFPMQYAPTDGTPVLLLLKTPSTLGRPTYSAEVCRYNENEHYWASHHHTVCEEWGLDEPTPLAWAPIPPVPEGLT